ncbi:response regulator [Hyphococcus sp.]|uniref:response regulator n=1 Tax=Hyphococcus sp. TaxID=2038636 RepID=UPI003CCBF6EA
MTGLKKIACVEDDADIRAIIKLALGDLGGFDVALYENGMDALEHVEQFQPQLIILDMMMPGIDGMETLKKIREKAQLKSTPAIFMTAKAQPSEVQNYVKSGALGVIVKPFDPVTLADQVNEFWRDAA